MSSDLPAPEGASVILEEHALLRDLLSRISAVRAPERISELPTLLSELHDLLTTHFRHEEESEGLVEAVREEAPRLVGRAEALLREHQDLLGRAAGLEAEVRSVLEGPVADVLASVKDLHDRLVAHDEAENALLHEAVLDDLGTGD
jgi:hypothetical protein